MLNNNATKMIKLRPLCGVSLPCDSDAPDLHGLKNLTANSAQSSQSNSSSKPQFHSSPNSPASVKVVLYSNPSRTRLQTKFIFKENDPL
ncbi:hypothetical protein P8452_60645 [Trifolium repens]|nr:hypothetical protein P8452_60645 [Trifolium repens]